MITLKIKQPGHTIAIPGLPALRSPAEIDISKLDVRVVAMYLKSSGIEKYEIVAETPKHKEVYTKKDFEDEKEKPKKETNEWEERFNRLESILEDLLTKAPRNESTNEEQIINKLDNLENILSFSPDVVAVKKPKNITQDPVIEEFDQFIPEVDTNGMKVNSSNNVKKVKQDDNIEDSADILAGLMKKK